MIWHSSIEAIVCGSLLSNKEALSRQFLSELVRETSTRSRNESAELFRVKQISQIGPKPGLLSFEGVLPSRSKRRVRFVSSVNAPTIRKTKKEFSVEQRHRSFSRSVCLLAKVRTLIKSFPERNRVASRIPSCYINSLTSPGLVGENLPSFSYKVWRLTSEVRCDLSPRSPVLGALKIKVQRSSCRT